MFVNDSSHSSLSSRKQKEAEILKQRKTEQDILYINEYCNELSWKRARNLLEENLPLFQDPVYRSRLNSEALALLESIEFGEQEE